MANVGNISITINVSDEDIAKLDTIKTKLEKIIELKKQAGIEIKASINTSK